MPQPDSHRAATERAVGQHIDDLAGVEIMGPLPVTWALRSSV
jgi:hypothetical protein